MAEYRDRPTLKIGELARRLGLNVRTLRYYESIGLLPSPPRTEAGYRLYSAEDEWRLRFVLQAKQIGLSLEEIGRILDLGRHGSACEYVRETVSCHIAEIDKRIAELQRLRAGLVQVAAARPERGGRSQGDVCGLIERWPLTPETRSEEVTVMAPQRRVEVFTAGCPICDPVVELVRRVACPHCAVTVYNVKDDPRAAERAAALNVQQLPMVLVEGEPLVDCQTSAITEAALRAAGLGRM